MLLAHEIGRRVRRLMIDELSAIPTLT